MAPLVVGDPEGLNSKASSADWKTFDRHLSKAKRRGVHAVTTDVWWGLVEKTERHYDWSYYDKLSSHIIKAGLKWIAIISLHKCGGNTGDTVNVNLPEWIWSKLAAKAGSSSNDAARYVSEQGNASSEFVSCWATALVLDDYKAFFAEFQQHFSAKKEHLSEINISLGPAGELRYPSYNQHDKNTDYPTRGALQCYSALARQSFIDYVLGKYGTIDSARATWGVLDKIEPPRNPEAFFANNGHIALQYGRDFFDWYNGSLLEHGRVVLSAALEVFSTDGAAFAGVDIGAKFPGVHWRMGHMRDGQIVFSDRLAELAAGLIPSYGWDAENVYGYRKVIALFHELQHKHARLILHFTCLELPDGDHESLAFQLVRWIGVEANHQSVPIKGENALNYTLHEVDSWKRLRAALELYDGLTILRLSDAVGTNRVARHEFRITCQLAGAMKDAAVQVKAA